MICLCSAGKELSNGEADRRVEAIRMSSVCVPCVARGSAPFIAESRVRWRSKRMKELRNEKRGRSKLQDDHETR